MASKRVEIDNWRARPGGEKVDGFDGNGRLSGINRQEGVLVANEDG